MRSTYWREATIAAVREYYHFRPDTPQKAVKLPNRSMGPGPKIT
jgi:hypothetical protein